MRGQATKRDSARSLSGFPQELEMSKDSFETTTRPRASVGDEFSGESFKEKFRAPGAASEPESAGSDFPALRADIAKLTQTVGKLLERQTSTARDQLAGAVGAAGDNIAQSASVAQDKLMSFEDDVGSQIKNNPWSAIAIAGLIGFLIGKVS
jgi:ElaB/YqjD/DUF883 family membrane-anchored ribosome-binding protein